ncbi:MAG: cytochrome c [Dehalococcoidia bacterium]|nr:cytochrome c [Dehalococcoidia bacterium]
MSILNKRVSPLIAGAALTLFLAACAPAAAPTPAPTKAPAASVSATAAPKPTTAATTAPAVATPTTAPAKPAIAATTAPPVSTPTTSAPAAQPTAAPAPSTPPATVAPPKPTAVPATPTQASQASTGGDAAAGKAVFDANCTACHPGGQQGAGPSLVGAVGRTGEARVTSQIRNGGGIMPPFPASKISDAQMASLIAYLATLK